MLVAAALAVAGCGAVGRVTTGDAAHGKELFLATTKSGFSCASCHTLADAKSTGTVGPNLDDAFSSDKQQGFAVQTIRDIVRGQIAYSDPEGAMPPNLYRGQDARDIAFYIAQCSANPNCGVTAETAAPPASSGGGSQSGGGGTTAAKPNGKHVFETAGCASCHTLKDAGSKGTIGPNLDQLKPSESIVQHQVETGGGAMPSFKDKLSAAQIAAVAQYVSSVAGK